MTIILQSDLVNAVGTPLLSQLFDDGAGSISAALVTEAITDAEADCMSILGPDFTLPLTGTTPRIVKRCCVDMAIFYGYERKPEFRVQGGENPESKRYDRAATMLRDIQKGSRDMGTGEAATDKSAASGGVVYSSTTTFIVDSGEGTDGPTGGF